MKKFSIIIPHYNQMKYIETVIKSVMIQDYKNIEVIIADDCSSQFDKNKVEDIIKKYNKNNFEYKIYSGKKNVGTVKNLNNALKLTTGDFITSIAADDKFFDKYVISNYVKEFEDEFKNVITTQCLMYDDKLKKCICKYVDSKKCLKYNKKSSDFILEKMTEGCFYGSGGTAYRKTVFEKYGYFNEKYLYVEDWAYWLYILEKGEKIYYADFNTLCHRDGGISHSEFTPETLPKHVRQYYKDILNIYVDEVLPYLDRFKVKENYKILKQFEETLLYYSSFAPELLSYQKDFDDARLSNKRLKYYFKFKTFMKIFDVNLIGKIKILLKYNRVVPITFVLWILSCIIINSVFNINNLNKLLGVYIFSYVCIYYITYILDKSFYYLNLIISRKKSEKNV